MTPSGSNPAFIGTAPWIACSNLSETLAYYQDVLGFRGSWSWLWGDPPDHAGVNRGRARICFFEEAALAKRFKGMEVVVYVEGVDDYYREVSRTARIVRHLGERPWGTIDFTVEDPDGVRLIFTEAPTDWE